MGRYLFPVACLAACAGIGWYNQTHADQIALLLLAPVLGDDPVLLGRVTVAVFGLLGVGSLVAALASRRAEPEE